MILQISLQRPMTAFVKELAICCQIIMTTVKFDGKKLPNELCTSFYCKRGGGLGKSPCSVNPSVPTIMQPRVRIPSKTSTLFEIQTVENDAIFVVIGM